jgi:hypothetical protein
MSFAAVPEIAVAAPTVKARSFTLGGEVMPSARGRHSLEV